MRPESHCSLDAAMAVVGGKWKVQILWALGQGVQRFGELRRLVPGVTEAVLSRQLRELETDLIVSRTTYDEAVLRVEYALTKRGAAPIKALEPLAAWGAEYLMGAGKLSPTAEPWSPGAGPVRR